MAMSDAQLMHAERMAKGEEQYQGKLVRSPTIRLERRGGSYNFVGPDSGACICSHIGRPNCDGQGKIVLRDVLAAPVMVHKPLDTCRGEHLWYKGYTNF